MRELILKTKNLGKKYRSRWAAHDINLEVYRGDIFGFLGPNGAGKSTTIRMMFDLIRPTNGNVEIFGHRVDKNKKEALKKVSGIVERPDFYLYLSAYQNMKITAALTLGKFPSKNLILENLKLVGLYDRAFDKVKTYSHGMKQRLGLAQALITKPELVVLDEPTNGLDPQGMKDVRELIKKLSKENGMTIFLSSHLLSEVEQVATRMAIINNGELVVQGSVKELLNKNKPEIRIETSSVLKVKNILTKYFGIEKLHISKNTLSFKADKKLIPKINSQLVKNNCEVLSITKNNSLEEYFLSITNK